MVAVILLVSRTDIFSLLGCSQDWRCMSFAKISEVGRNEISRGEIDA
jgi:hypothetical protein